MSTLHTINQTPSSKLLESCCQTLNDGDAILFIEDGVYHIRDNAILDAVSKDVSLYCLKEDLAARGLQDNNSNLVDIISCRKFVALCTEHDKVVSWF